MGSMSPSDVENMRLFQVFKTENEIKGVENTIRELETQTSK